MGPSHVKSDRLVSADNDYSNYITSWYIIKSSKYNRAYINQRRLATKQKMFFQEVVFHLFFTHQIHFRKNALAWPSLGSFLYPPRND